MDILWEDLKVPTRPYPFEIPYHGQTHEERARIRRQVYAELEERRLTYRGQLEPEVEDALRMLYRSEVSIAATALLDKDTMLRARLSATGQYAVLARMDGGMLQLEQLPASSLVRRAVSLLPPHPPGPHQSVTFPIPEPERPRPGAEGNDQVMQQVSTPHVLGRYMRELEPIVGRPRLRIGQFTVSTGDRLTHQTQLPPLGWFDTDEGRYLMQQRRGQDGRTWAVYAPVDASRLGQRLTEMVREVRTPPRY